MYNRVLDPELSFRKIENNIHSDKRGAGFVFIAGNGTRATNHKQRRVPKSFPTIDPTVPGNRGAETIQLHSTDTRVTFV